MDEANAVEIVIRTLRRELPMLAAIDLRADTPLLSTGLLDSFAVVTLLAALDGVFGIDLDVESIELEQFETASTIAALCMTASSGRRG